MWYDPIDRPSTSCQSNEGNGAMSALANAIRKWLEDNQEGIRTQNQLADAADISRSALSNIMTSDAIPRPATIIKLARAMGIDGVLLTSLLGYPVQPSGEPDAQYVQLARQLAAFPWLVQRANDFLHLPESEFREAMDYLDHRRRRRRGGDRSSR